MNRKLLLALLVVLMGMAACASPATTTPGPTGSAAVPVGTQPPADQPAAVPQAAQRVVSLAPSNTEILFAVGAGPQVVGRDSLSDYPSAASQVPDIGGGYMALNMELILASKPDLVLASPITPPEQLAELQAVGLNIQTVSNPRTFEELYGNLISVGGLTGHAAEAEALVTALKVRVDTVTGQVSKAAERPVVFYELDATDPNAPYTSGPGTFVDLVIGSAGGTNFGAELDAEWVQVSVEELLRRQPDFILLGDNTYGGVTPEQVRLRSGWDALTAVQQNRIFIFDDNLVSRPGPRLIDGLEAMAKLLHPDIVK